jgi:cytochrome c556
MKRVLSIASVLFSFVFAVSLAAQQAPAKIASDADYVAHMKEVGQLNGVMTKSIKGGDAAEAGKAAMRLEVLFKNVHGYWAAKKVTDATDAAQTAVTSLAAIQKALTANDMAAAETARATMATSCAGCHKEHREKLPEGGWRIK